MVMIVDQDAREIRLQAVKWGERLASLALPPGVEVEVTRESDEGPVTFDRSGRSRDYTVALGVDERQLGWQVYGLTGYVAETSR